MAGDPFEATTWWDRYGALGLGIFVFAGVIAYLFRLLVTSQQKRIEKTDREVESAAKERNAERDQTALERSRWEIEKNGWEIERAGWETERTAIRAEFEGKHRQVVDDYAKELRRVMDDSRAHEDAVRREFAELMETISANHTKASEANVAVLQKFYDRFVGPKARRF